MLLAGPVPRELLLSLLNHDGFDDGFGAEGWLDESLPANETLLWLIVIQSLSVDWFTARESNKVQTILKIVKWFGDPLRF